MADHLFPSQAAFRPDASQLVNVRRWEKARLFVGALSQRKADTVTLSLNQWRNDKARDRKAFAAIERGYSRYQGDVGRALAQGMDVEVQNDEGYSLLTWAVKHRRFMPMVHNLIQPEIALHGSFLPRLRFPLGKIKGADINKPDGRGYTALHEAAGMGDIENSLMLMRAGADPYLETPDGLNFFDVLYAAPRYGGVYPSNGMSAVESREIEALRRWYEEERLMSEVDGILMESDPSSEEDSGNA